jgi:HK97 gp10 family phage protein
MAVSYSNRPSGRRVSLKWNGVPELVNTYQKVAQVLDDRTPDVKAVILLPCETAMDKAQSLAPQADRVYPGYGGQKFEPGTLKSAIYAMPGRSNARGVLMKVDKTVAYYAPFVEFGTSKMQARPYFRPAILQMQSTYLADIAPGLQKLIEKTSAQYAYHAPAE